MKKKELTSLKLELSSTFSHVFLILKLAFLAVLMLTIWGLFIRLFGFVWDNVKGWLGLILTFILIIVGLFLIIYIILFFFYGFGKSIDIIASVIKKK